MIEAKNLTFSYGGKSVLQGVNFTIEDARLTAILGRNGAGKTTLLRCLLGAPCEGEVYIDGARPQEMSAGKLAKLVAYIPQTRSHAFDYSVFDTALMGTTAQLGLFNSPADEQRKATMEALEAMGVAALRARSFSHISGGEQQLVLIARALGQKARVLLMDEPTASLDYGNQLLVMEKARELSREGYTVVMSTHNPQHALSYADRVIALKGGVIVCDGESGEVLTGEMISNLYDVDARVFDAPTGKVILAASAKRKDV